MLHCESEKFFVPGEMFSKKIKPDDDPDSEWTDFETDLKLQKTLGGWVANTPDGRRKVEVYVVNFSPVISYELGSDIHRNVTRVPHLDPREITQ